MPLDPPAAARGLPRPLPAPTWRDRADEAWRWWTGLSGRVRWAAVSVAGVVVVVVVAVSLVAPRMRATAGGSGAGGGDSALPRAGTATDPSGFRSGSGATTMVDGASGGSGLVVVYVAGAVARPGVYRLTGDIRVTDAIDAAGGVTAEADLAVMNLAAKVSDGQRVYVPRHGETPPPEVGPTGGSAAGGAGGGGGANAVVNLNTATETELETLPGVGPSTAKSIIDYRTQHGPFHRVDDLLNVRGIGPSKVDQIRPHAIV